MEHGEDKRRLRRELQQRRRELAPNIRVQQSAELCAVAAEYMKSLRQNVRHQPLTVFSYLAYRDEPDTWPLLASCWEQGDHVVVPRIHRQQQGIFELYEIHSIEDVEPGMYGIPEPKLDCPQYPSHRWHEIDLIIVPGLGYDCYGGRIGYGGGYYDRFMEQLAANGDNHPLLAAPAFEQQLVSRIPMEPHDFRVGLLFTPSGVLTTNV